MSLNTVFGSALIGVAVPIVIQLPSFLMIRKFVAGDPLKMMKANVYGFLARLVLYGIAVGVLVSVSELRMIPFILSFTGLFVLLHLGEGLYFRRLFSTREK